jgi:hypothetical protein
MILKVLCILYPIDTILLHKRLIRYISRWGDNVQNKLDSVKLERDTIFNEIKDIAIHAFEEETIIQPIDLEVYGSMRTGNLILLNFRSCFGIE